jgi:hypothetical protein
MMCMGEDGRTRFNFHVHLYTKDSLPLLWILNIRFYIFYVKLNYLSYNLFACAK